MAKFINSDRNFDATRDKSQGESAWPRVWRVADDATLKIYDDGSVSLLCPSLDGLDDVTIATMIDRRLVARRRRVMPTNADAVAFAMDVIDGRVESIDKELSVTYGLMAGKLNDLDLGRAAKILCRAARHPDVAAAIAACGDSIDVSDLIPARATK